MDSPETAGTAENARSQECAAYSGLTGFQIVVVLATGLLFCYGVNRHWGYLNGIEQLTHWEWAWRNETIRTILAQTALPFLIIAGVLWRINRKTACHRIWPALGLLVISSFLLQMAGKLTYPDGLKVVQAIVESNSATGYFEDAVSIGDPALWLRRFHLAKLTGHSWTHPPGPILFYHIFLRAFDPANAAFIGGLAVGLLGSLGVAVMYFFSALWTKDAAGRLTAAAYYALLPGLILFLPEFDQIYPVLSMLLILTWVKALTHAKPLSGYAWAGGLLLSIALFFAYNLLTIGVFLLGYALVLVRTQNWAGCAFRRCLASSGVIAGVWIGLYAVLWGITGYNPVLSFLRSLWVQSQMAAALERDYRIFIITDLYDFLLGSGIIAAPIVFFYMHRLWKRSGLKNPELALSVFGIATVAVIDLTGLLRGETTRVWLFLQPLLIAPAAVAVSRTGLLGKLSIFTLQWLIIVSLLTNMVFVVP